jgi:F-type H+-transporting ATPase subunit delta
MAKLEDRYANALFELSVESDSLEEDLKQAILVRETFKSVDVQGFLVNPDVPDAAKQQLFHNAFSGKISQRLMGFLFLMVRKKREMLIVPVLTEYIERVNRRLGRIEAKVVSAKALTEKQIEAIRTVLSQKIERQVEVNTTVDPDVLGGFYILVIYNGPFKARRAHYGSAQTVPVSTDAGRRSGPDSLCFKQQRSG